MLPFNARRIVFEESYRRPEFVTEKVIFTQPKRRYDPLRNADGQFFAHIDEKTPYVREFVRRAQELGLTVSGDGTATVKGGDITKAQKGDVITVGSSSKFDVNWAKRDGYVCDKGYAPVYNLHKDWAKVNKALENFAAEKKAVKLENGTNVRFHHSFMVIDGRVYNYKNGQVAIVMPEQVLRDICVQFGIINVVISR